MIRGLHIENIAVVKNLDIDLDSGFCVLTGETGAGKSILVDAFFIILGNRASKEIIRKNDRRSKWIFRDKAEKRS